MAIAVIGAAGQLGRDLCSVLGAEAVALTHRDIDLIDRESLSRVLGSLRPQAVINVAAFNLVDDAESRVQDAFGVNAFGVRELSLVCRDLGCVPVHCSTDYVFGLDRTRTLPYQETDTPGPISAYGLSKLAGEYFVRSICPRHFVLRTCGLYGLHGVGGKGQNFVETMLRLARERGRVRVVNDQTCTPTSTVDVAEAIQRLLGTNAFGLYHWTNAGNCTWYEFACEIFRQARVSVECVPITSDEFGARAVRPTYSVLSTAKWERLGFGQPRLWKDALAAYMEARKVPVMAGG